MLAAMAGLPPFSTANEAAPDLADLLAQDAPEITLDMPPIWRATSMA